jgi:hypothetical protein
MLQKSNIHYATSRSYHESSVKVMFLQSLSLIYFYDRVIEVQSLAGAEDFSSSLCVQTGSGAHPAFCPVGTGGPSSRGKTQPGRDADHSPPSSAEVIIE